MVCLKCSSEEFKIAIKAVEQIFKGKFLIIHDVEVSECIKCGWYCLATGQGTKLLNKTK